MPEQVMQFEWMLPASEAETQRRALADAGAELSAPRPFVPPEEEKDLYVHAAFEPMLIVAGVVASGYLVNMVIDAVRRSKRSGVLIDRRDGKLVIHEVPSMEHGTVMVLAEDGKTEQFDTRRSPAELEMLKGLLLGGGK